MLCYVILCVVFFELDPTMPESHAAAARVLLEPQLRHTTEPRVEDAWRSVRRYALTTTPRTQSHNDYEYSINTSTCCISMMMRCIGSDDERDKDCRELEIEFEGCRIELHLPQHTAVQRARIRSTNTCTNRAQTGIGNCDAARLNIAFASSTTVPRTVQCSMRTLMK